MEDRRGVRAAEKTRGAINRPLVVACWVLVVLLFASQWYTYDTIHGAADPFLYYLGWSSYMWGVLTPAVLWVARRHPIDSGTWRRALPLHVATSVVLTVFQLSLEACVEWLRTGGHSSLSGEVRHYLSQHTQISLLTYWVLVTATRFYRMYDQARRRQLQAAQLEARLAETQLEVLRMQLQPHFLFNTLQAAATLIHDDPGGAEDILVRLSQLLRVSLDELQAQEISLTREIEFLEHYISIQRRRFGDRLRFDLHIDEGVLDCSVPSLVLQPLVENAIRHGIAKYKENDVVTFRAFQKQDRLCLEVSNLTGALEDRADRLLTRGVGLSNTRARLEQLYGQEQSLQLFNLQPRGVAALLSIPARRSPSGEKVPVIATAR